MDEPDIQEDEITDNDDGSDIIDSDLDSEMGDIEKIQDLGNKDETNFNLLDYEDNEVNTLDVDDSDDDDDNYQKFTNGLNNNYLDYFHSESNIPNYLEIQELSKIIRDKNGNIIDKNHKTVPILTKYEKTRILGQRAKQINNGSKPYINVSENIIDGYLIAEMELKEKKIPFIIRRPLPNQTFEYWKIKDLEIYY
jgi:DNA-directed RNA polymerase subunit K/omega